MKIIIVDDSAANLAAAKKASESFQEHEFVFVNNASDALGLISSADAIITDLFFPDENHAEGKALGYTYNKYCAKLTKGEIYMRVLQEYYSGDFERAQRGLTGAIAMANDGTNRVPLEELMQGKKIPEISSGQFPYGGAVMLEAYKARKNACLISDIHSHAGEYRDHSSSVDGIILLLPLIEMGILTIEQAKFDGGNSLTYVGQAGLDCAIGGYRHDCVQKEQPESWVEAIRRVIAQ